MSENASAGSSVKIRKTKRETLSEWFRSPGFKCILMGIVTFLLILILFFVVCVPKKYQRRRAPIRLRRRRGADHEHP